MIMKRLTILMALVLSILMILTACGKDEAVASSEGKEIAESLDANAKPVAESAIAMMKNVTHYAEIDIKDYGTITVALDAGSAPITVENFVTLAKDGFYDGLTFHRIISGFMMQGGDPAGNGTGGSGNYIKGEFAANGVANGLTHVRGAISMARRGDSYDSGTSQFFIVHEDSTFLDGNYAAFGYVTSGIGVVDAVCSAAQPTDGNGSIAKAAQPVINSITIREAE